MSKSRIELPEGVNAFDYVVTQVGSPALQQRLKDSWKAQMLNDSTLTPREREAARIRSAYNIGCTNCVELRMARDLPGFSDEPIDEGVYENVFAYSTWPGYTTRERLIIEFVERHAEDYRALAEDDEFWTRLKDNFTDVELADLCLLCGTWDAATKMYHLLVGVDAACQVPVQRTA